jgi:hypothetical protein
VSRRRPRNRILQWVVRSGPDDPIYNLWLLSGPLLIVLVAVVGKNAVTTLLAAGYVVGFITHTAYNAFETTGRPGWIRRP